MDRLVAFLFEVGQLKREPRSGWTHVGVKVPESVADHTCRATFVAYILGKLEGVDAQKAALIAAFHDLPETRIGDMHKITARYVTEKKAIEQRVAAEQVALLPDGIAQEFAAFFDGFDDDASPEHVVAKDADYLEAILQAKEYVDQGYAAAQGWITNASKCLKTEHAKKLAKEIAKTTSTDWYEHLKRVER